MNIQNDIKNIAFSDYRTQIPGVVCDIYECNQYSGFSSVLKVAPLGYLSTAPALSEKIKLFNVTYCGTAGIYGFPTLIKELYYAYVLTNNPSFIDGQPAILIPKNVLHRNPGKNYANEPDEVKKSDLKKLIVKKENLVKSRKFA